MNSGDYTMINVKLEGKDLVFRNIYFILVNFYQYQ